MNEITVTHTGVLPNFFFMLKNLVIFDPDAYRCENDHQQLLLLNEYKSKSIKLLGLHISFTIVKLGLYNVYIAWRLF